MRHPSARRGVNRVGSSGDAAGVCFCHRENGGTLIFVYSYFICVNSLNVVKYFAYFNSHSIAPWDGTLSIP